MAQERSSRPWVDFFVCLGLGFFFVFCFFVLSSRKTTNMPKQYTCQVLLKHFKV